MSREVDERVVQMQFDNAQFERGTRQTMSTLEKLKQSLQFTGAEKGFERISSASQKVDFSELTNALEGIQNKFSTMNIVAVSALTNITNRAIATGERLIKSLSVDQIASGWDKYVEKTGNVQTIMNATGKSIDQVNGYLNKLMWYSDETSFSFAEMTSALSQMTAAGGNIDKMIPMIMGIANATADAGKSGLAFQSTIRNITQSYSAGFLQLQDWKSLNLMGTATKALKQELIDTATELGVLDKNGYDSAKHLVNLSTFETTLSDKWANTTVMEKTFEKYSSMMQEAYEMVQKDPSLSTSEALEQLSGKYGEIAERSALAAQQAKSFKEVLDATSDAVSSKWMKAFETIFGNYEEATATWTEMANRLYEVFAEPLNDLNRELAAGLDNGWQQFQSKLGDSSDFYVQMLEQVMVANGSITQEAINEAGGFAAALREGGVSAEQLQNGLNESYRQLSALAALGDDDLKAKDLDPDQVKKLAKGFAELNDEVSKGKLDLSEYSEKIGEISGREHLMQSIWNIFDAIGKIVEPIQKAWAKFFEGIDSDKIYSFAEAVDRMTAKLSISDETADKIERTFSGVFAVLNVGRNALLAVGKVLGQVFNAVSPLAGGFLSVTAALGDCLVEMADAINNSTVFQTVLDGIHWVIGKVSEGMQAFAGVLTNVSNNVSVVFDPLKTLGEWFTSFINFIAPGLYAFGSAADEAFKEFGTSAKEAFNSLDTEKLANMVNSGLIAGILVGIKGFLKSAKELTSSAGDIIGTIKNTIGSLGEAIDAWKQSRKTETLMTIAKSVAIMAASLTVLSMIKPERLAGGIGALTATIGELVGAFLLLDKFGGNTKSMKFIAMSTTMVAMASSTLILAGAAAKLASIDSEKLVSSMIALGAVMGGLTVVSVVLSKTGGKFMKGATGMIAFATAIRILASAVNAMSGLSWDQMKVGLGGIGILCIELIAFLAASKFDKLGVLKGTGLILLATALNILQSAVAKFSGMNWDEIQNGLTAVGIALAEFAAFGFVAGFSKKMLTTSSSVLILSSSMVVLSRAMSSISGLDGESIKRSLIAIGGALAEFVIALKLTKGTLGSAASLTTMTVAINLLVPALTGLGNLSLAQIGIGLLAIAGAFVVVGVAAALLAPVAPVIVSLSLAISALAISIGAMVALTTAADFFGRLSDSLSALNGLSFQVFLNNIKAVAWLLVEFIAGIFQGVAAIAGSIASSIATIVSAVCDGIAQAAPSIGNALTQLITTVCNVIVQCSEPIGQALFTLGTVAIQTLIDLIGWAWDGGGGEGDGIKGALEGLWENVKSFIGEHLNPANLFNVQEGSLLDKLFGAANKAADERNATEYGESVGGKLAEGIDNSQKSIKDSSANLAKTVDEATKDSAGIGSPSTMMEENGYWLIMGLAQGMEDPAGMAAITTACGNISSAINEQFRNYWGIHSPSDLAYGDGGNIVAGLTNGLTATDQLQSNLTTLNNGIRTTLLDGLDTTETEATAKASGIVSAVSGILDGTTTAEDILKKLGGFTDTTTPTNTSSSTSSSSTSKSTKTAAEVLEDAYSAKLKSNKYLQDVADKEWDLWDAGEGKNADNDTYITKKSEALDKALELQEKRVSIAQEQYDKLQAEASSTEDQKNEALSTLLDEQKSLTELQRERYDSLYEEVLSRYSDAETTADDEYEHWTALNEKTASVEAKSNRKIQNITEKIGIQGEIVKTSLKTYNEVTELLGETSQEAKSAYQDWLEADTEYLKLQNELHEAQLEVYDDQIDRYDTEMKTISNRQNLLTKLYENGEYGVVARTINTTGAVQNMAYSLDKISAAAYKYDSYVQNGMQHTEEGIAALQSLQEEQYSFVGYAETLADALDLSDDGKRMMMQFGYAVSNNWNYLRDGFDGAYKKIQAAFPDMAQRLSNLWGLFQRDGMAETITTAASTFVSIIEGDYGSALGSALNLGLTLAGTDFGKTLIDHIKETIKSTNWTSILSGIPLVSKLFGEGGLLAGAGTTIAGFAAKIAAMAGLSVPQLGLIAAAVGAIGFAGYELVKHWDDIKQWFAGFGEWWSNLFQNLWKGISGFITSVKDAISGFFTKAAEVGGNIAKGIWNGVSGAAKGVWNGVKSVGTGIINGFKSLFGIHSPSTVMTQMGGYIGQGLANGITGTEKTVGESMRTVGTTAIHALTDLEAGNYSPTISPVVDLSEAGSGSWNQSLFRTENGYGAETTRTAMLAASTMRSNENQNRTNPAQTTNNSSDVVSAISQLGDRVDKMGEKISRMKLVMDSGKTVGELTPGFDSSMGRRSLLAERGVI